MSFAAVMAAGMCMLRARLSPPSCAPHAGQFGMVGPVAAPSMSDLMLDEETALVSNRPPAAVAAAAPERAPPASLPMPNLSRLSPFAAAFAGPPAASLPAGALALAASKLVGGLGLNAPNPAGEGTAFGTVADAGTRGVWPGSPAGADAAAAAFAPSDRMAQGLGFTQRESLGSAADIAVADAAAAAAAGPAERPARTFSGGFGGGGLDEDARSWSTGLLALPEGGPPGGLARVAPAEARRPSLLSGRGVLVDARGERGPAYGRRQLSTHPAHSSAAANAATIAAVAASSAIAGGRQPREGGRASPGKEAARRRVRIASAPVLVQDE